MKNWRCAAIALCFGGLIAGVGGQVNAAPDVINTRAPLAFALDTASGTTLYTKDPDKPFSLGSLTRFVTAAVVIDALSRGDINPQTAYPVSEHAWRTGGAPSGRTTMFAALKSVIPVQDLLRGLIIQNANDAAIILAEGMDGSEAAFAQRMNAFVTRIGMKDSHFSDPTGADDAGNVTTVRDMAHLATYLLNEHPNQVRLFSEPSFEWNNIFQRNKDTLIADVQGADGFAIGYSPASGFSAVLTVRRNQRRLVVVTAGLKTEKDREAAVNEVTDGTYDAFALHQLYAAGEVVQTARVFNGEQSSVPLVASKPINILLPVAGWDDYKLRVRYKGPIPAPVTHGKPVGNLVVLDPDGVEVLHAPLTTGEDVAVGSRSQRVFDGLRELLLGWY